jgi:hypothetical protein
MSDWNNYKAKYKTANIVSTLSNAPLIALFMFLGLSYYFLKRSEERRVGKLLFSKRC